MFSWRYGDARWQVTTHWIDNRESVPPTFRPEARMIATEMHVVALHELWPMTFGQFASFCNNVETVCNLYTDLYTVTCTQTYIFNAGEISQSKWRFDNKLSWMVITLSETRKYYNVAKQIHTKAAPHSVTDVRYCIEEKQIKQDNNEIN